MNILKVILRNLFIYSTHIYCRLWWTFFWTLLYFLNFNIWYFKRFHIIWNKRCILWEHWHFFILGDSSEACVWKAISEIKLVLGWHIYWIDLLGIPEILIILIVHILSHHVIILCVSFLKLIIKILILHIHLHVWKIIHFLLNKVLVRQKL